MARKRIEIIKERPTGRNEVFRDNRTGATMSRAQFVKETERGAYDDCHVRKIDNVKTPVSNPDDTEENIVNRRTPACLVAWVGLTVLALALGARSETVAAGQETIVIPGEVSCPECEIRVETVMQLGDDSGPGMVGSENVFVARDAQGRYYLHSYDPGRVAIRVFSETGQFLTTFGSLGQGPGEFQMISAIRPDDEGGVVVYDIAQRRMSTFSSSHEFVESLQLDLLPGFDLTRLSNGQVVLAGDYRRPSLIGVPLHLLGVDGRLIRSFGESASFYPGSGGHSYRIAKHGDIGVWATPDGSLLLDLWSLDGVRLASLHRGSLQLLTSEDDPEAPKPTIAALQESEGLLWVFTMVVDPSTGDLLARKRIDIGVFPVSDGLVGGVISTPGGDGLRFQLLRLHLER